MGGSESKGDGGNPEHSFDDEEKSKAGIIFALISHGKKHFNVDQFKHFTQNILDEMTSSRLFDFMAAPLPHHQHHHHKRPHLPHLHDHSHEISLQRFISHLTYLLKGNITDQSRVCLFLASKQNTGTGTSPPETVSETDLKMFISNILQSYEHVLAAHCAAYQSWMFASSKSKESHKTLANSLLKDVLKFDPSAESVTFDASDIELWLHHCKLFKQILNHVFIGTFQFYVNEPSAAMFSPRIPRVRDTNWSQCGTMLDFLTVMYLNHSLSYQLQTQWKLLFSSRLHGASFSTLLGKIKDQGPTLMVIQDKSGHVFGGFNATSWTINPKFTGNSNCFLFKSHPFYGIYRATGYNDNYAYLNYHVQTMPNGLGMGGQLEFFGLWIDQEFDHGHSKAGSKGCTTYGSPQLSADTEFTVNCMEVWQVGKVRRKDGDDDDDDEEDYDDDEDDDDNQGGAKSKSILDRVHTADKALLDFVDKGTVSDHMRDEPLVEETAQHNTIISPY